MPTCPKCGNETTLVTDQGYVCVQCGPRNVPPKSQITYSAVTTNSPLLPDVIIVFGGGSGGTKKTDVLSEVKALLPEESGAPDLGTDDHH